MTKKSTIDTLFSALGLILGILFIHSWWRDPSHSPWTLPFGASFLISAIKDFLAQRVGHVSWFQRDDVSYKDFKALDLLSLVNMTLLIITMVLLIRHS